MASVQKRGDKFRVRIRPKNLPTLSMTFLTYIEALEWVEEHEQKYIDDPEVYQKWIKLNRQSMDENGIFHLHIPLEDF